MNPFKVGDWVRVASIGYTEKKYGTNGRMFQLMESNERGKVEYVDQDAVRIDGSYWHYKDIVPHNIPKKEPKIFHYDTSLLDIERNET